MANPGFFTPAVHKGGGRAPGADLDRVEHRPPDPFRWFKVCTLGSCRAPEPAGSKASSSVARSKDFPRDPSIPSQKVIGDYLCRLGGPKYLFRRYVDP